MRKTHPFFPYFIAGLLTAALFVSGCGLFGAIQGTQSGSGSNPKNATATSTPFLPYAPTAVSSAPIFPTATPRHSPTPTVVAIPNTTGGGVYQSSSASVPPPAPMIQQPANQINILVLGSDKRAYTGGYRTDVNLLVTVNFQLKTINMTSFPRDLYVYIPGYGQDRINAIQPRGGFPLSAAAYEYNFGVRPDYYLMLEFSGFTNIIDMLGGINVQVAQQLTDQRDGYGYYTVYPGIVHMNGETALWYVRARYTTSDFDRTRRQQEVMLAVVDRMIKLDMIPKIPDLYTQYQNMVSTDLALEDIIPLVPLASEFFQGNIGRYAIGSSHVSQWVTSDGSAVLLPNTAAIQAVLQVALNVE
jgi:LCP family protein required for cell wall assembly